MIAWAGGMNEKGGRPDAVEPLGAQVIQLHETHMRACRADHQVVARFNNCAVFKRARLSDRGQAHHLGQNLAELGALEMRVFSPWILHS